MKAIHIFLSIVFLSVVAFSSCSDSSGPNLTPKVNIDSPKKEYRGGLMKLWVQVPGTVTNLDDIRWVTGKATIAERFSQVDRNEIVADTVYIHWEQPPTMVLTLDSTLNDSGGVENVDTTVQYFDSIGVVVNDIPSEKIQIEIFNILPKIDSIFTGNSAMMTGTVADSTILLAANPGEKVRFSLTASDALDTNYQAVFEWPEIGDMTVQTLPDDSLVSWSIRFPTTEVDTVVEFRVKDTGGWGIRVYNLHFVSYQESGSAWVAAQPDLVKVSRTGSEVKRISGEFRRISDIILNPNSNEMWVLDEDANALYYYNTFGELRNKDTTTFRDPQSIAIDVESGFLWVSDLVSAGSDSSQIRRFDLSSPDSLREVGNPISLGGPAKALSVDQFERDLIWFVVPETDTIGYLVNNGSSIQTNIFDESNLGFRLNRPSKVSYDPFSGYAWIADSSRVVVIDTTGAVQAHIKGFQFANSISAAGNVCWISDILSGEVIRFTKSQIDAVAGDTLRADEGLSVDTFVSPSSVSTFGKDQSVWVSDKDAGQVYLVGSDGTVLQAIPGLKLPSLVRVHQVIE